MQDHDTVLVCWGQAKHSWGGWMVGGGGGGGGEAQETISRVGITGRNNKMQDTYWYYISPNIIILW